MLSSKQLFQIAPIGIKGLARGAHLDDLDEITLKQNYIIVTCSGTIGRTLLVPAYMDGWATNQHSLRVIPRDEIIAAYLYAWLASPYGQTLLKRYSYGSVILELDRHMLAKIPIPMSENAIVKIIAELVLKGNQLRDEAWELEQNALKNLTNLIAQKKAKELTKSSRRNEIR